ncbi:MAG: group 1 glycosyl transferase [Ignavibacteria bacterium]|nr:MAG: group 1 glycosyl transferase [Ignavibacteria bacterium]KAF0160168.1 MAG: group 1 glycosyl transferase [Ignavibacteria bacterium]
MTICFASRECFPAYYGGIGSHFYFQMKMLKENGHKVVFVTHKYQNANIDEMIKYYEGIEVVFVNSSRQFFPTHENLNNSHLLWLSIHDLIATEGYQFDFIIFPDCGGEGFFTILANTIYGLYNYSKVLIEIEGPMKDVAVRNKNILDEHYELTKLIEEYCFNNCYYFTSPTKIMINELHDYLNNNKSEFAIVPNLVNPNFLENNNEASHKEKNIFFLGRLEYRKGPDLLIEAFSEIIEEYHGSLLKLKFAGRDQYWSDYNKTFMQNWKHIIKDNNSIEFLEFLSHNDLEKVFSSTWVAVFPSRWEPFGNVALEAMLAGVPVVVPKGTGLEEIVGDNYKYTFEAGNKLSLAKTLRSILELSDEEHKILSNKVKQTGRELLLNSQEVFVNFLTKNYADKKEAHISSSADKIFEIFHSFALLGGDNHQRYDNLYKDYSKINELYQQKSKEYAEIEKRFEIINRENLLMKEYLRTIQIGKS